MKPPSVKALWYDHYRAKFPESCYPGGDLVTLDADIAGCVQTYLSSRRSLDKWRLALLGICYHEVRTQMPRLRGSAKVYFGRLEKMAGAVLHEIERANRKR